MSIKYSRIIILSCVTLIMAGCVGPGRINTGYKVIEYPSHIVSKGDTLYSIAWQAGYDYREVARWNNIRWPYQIHPGQRIYLSPYSESAAQQDSPQQPEPAEQQTASVSENKPTPRKVKKTKQARRWQAPVKPAKSSGNTTRKSASQSKVTASTRWAWPVRGKIINGFSVKEPGKKGVDIAGREGQAIRAAATGRVVYCGNGLRGYGNLIIIKHNETYFSAYAHSRKIHVKENQKVKLGDKIADMGKTGTSKTMLHFEIRKNGLPVNPLEYLPK